MTERMAGASCVPPDAQVVAHHGIGVDGDRETFGDQTNMKQAFPIEQIDAIHHWLQAVPEGVQAADMASIPVR